MDETEPSKVLCESNMNQGDKLVSSLPQDMEISDKRHSDKQGVEHGTNKIRLDLITGVDPKSSIGVKVSNATSTLPGTGIVSIASESDLTSTPEYSKRKRSIQPDNLAESQEAKSQILTFTNHPFKRLKPIQEDVLTSTTNQGTEDQDLYGLTRSIWGLVFQFLPPATLARLLRVSRSFSSLLMTGYQKTLSIDQTNARTALCESENIWRKCHELFAPGLPSPIQGQTELSMWKLIKGKRCQTCGAEKLLQTTAEAFDVWTAGPDVDHVRVLWPFLTRLCGQCVRNQCQKEKELLLSNTIPSFLIEELPFMFVLDSGDCVSASTLRDNSVPFGLKLTKIFYKPQVAYLKQTYYDLASRNAGPLDAWMESLALTRAKQTHDCGCWESWERKGILSRINRIKTKTTSCRAKTQLEHNHARNIFPIAIQPSVRYPPSDLKDQSSTNLRGSEIKKPADQQQHHQSMKPHEPSEQLDVQSPADDDNLQNGISTIREIRRCEILRRCALLEPPISSELLDQMSSFHMALQIKKEMDDQQWGILRDRLTSERPEANMRLQAVKEKTAARKSAGQTDGLSKPDARKSLSVLDRNVVPIADATQERLAVLARSIIRNNWDDGNSLGKDACSQLAAEVLVQTREAYLAESSNVTEPSMTHSRLTMENMKWLFENFIRPLTEQHQKEIFLCSRCENTAKIYGFEAVIQHYAAKHTNSLSLGNVIVHWKAEWPQEPPFHPNPMHVKAHAIAMSTSQNPRNQSLRASDTCKYESPLGPRNEFDDKLYESRFIGAHTLQRSNRAISFPNHGNSPSQRINMSNPVVPASVSMTSSMDPYRIESIGHDVPASNNHNLANTDMHVVPLQFGVSSPVTGSSLPEVAIPTTEMFRTHQAEMAKLARELWFTTAGIKGLPGPLRVQTIIHHASERFVNRFGVEPGVNMFLFGLNHEAAMRPLRSLNGFSCRACMLGQPGSLPNADQRKSQTLPHLLNHFMASHAEYYRLDWRRDMIHLPSIRIISDLIHAPGMDDSKFALFVAAFPNAFLNPSSSFDHRQSNFRLHLGYESIDHRPENTQASNNAAIEGSKGYSGIVPLISVGQNVTSSVDNEYDPRRPAYLGRLVDGQQSQAVDPGFARNASYDSTQGYQPADADRFLQRLKPQSEERNPLRSKPHPYVDITQVQYDEVYISNESDQHSYTSHIARSDQLPPMDNISLQRSNASFPQDPEYDRNQPHWEREIRTGPRNIRKVSYHPMADDSIPTDVLITPASARYNQPVTSHYRNLTGLSSSAYQYAQQHASAEYSRLPNYLIKPELIVAHASDNANVEQTEENTYYSYNPTS